jgi:hypothetical protein
MKNERKLTQRPKGRAYQKLLAPKFRIVAEKMRQLFLRSGLREYSDFRICHWSVVNLAAHEISILKLNLES